MIKTYPIDESRASFKRDYHPVVKRILLARNLLDDDALNTGLSTMESPDSMLGLLPAIDLLESALDNNRKILICGDYDADGATSTALLIRVLKQLGHDNIDFLVPNRFDFGYGLSVELVEVAAQSKPDLIITVDNGISSIAGVGRARRLGIDVLVTDHHLPGEELPDANAIVNPNQPGCAFPSKHLAGVGVVFYLLVALRARLRMNGWFEKRSIEQPKLERYLDIVALGTVADVVVLDRLNRVLVANGIRLIRSGRGNPGIRSLFNVSGRDFSTASSTDLGFAIGPRINAAGRLDDITEGILCLLEDDEQRAQQYALEMHQINQDRRQIQEQMIIEAERALKGLNTDQTELPWGYSCYQKDWHQGLVGLVASRIKEKLHRPVIAFARAETENSQSMPGASTELKGSGRSIPGLHIRDCLELVSKNHPGLIKKFGGHAMAAGLSIQESDYPVFADAFDQAVRQGLSEDDLNAITWVDGALDNATLNLAFAHTLENLLPWGQGIPEPRFIGEFEVLSLRWLKETHLKMRLIQDGVSEVLEAIWFSAPTDIVSSAGDRFKGVYTLGVNRYMGRETLQLMISKGESLK